MKFEDLKDAKPFETVLVGAGGIERYFVAIDSYNEKLITSKIDEGYATEWQEDSILNWHIKKDTKKITLYRYTVKYNVNRFNGDVWQSDWMSIKFDDFTKSYRDLELLKTETKEIEIDL